MNRVFVALGSNIGDRLGFLQTAVDALGRAPGVVVRSTSSVYETEPFGKKDQPYFLNAVIELGCSLTAEELLATLKAIERTIGRTPTERWGPREIDLDLIYFDGSVIAASSLVVPHPEVASRRFVLEPLVEIASDFVDPVRKLTVREILLRCPDKSSIAQSSFRIHTTVVES